MAAAARSILTKSSPIWTNLLRSGVTAGRVGSPLGAPASATSAVRSFAPQSLRFRSDSHSTAASDTSNGAAKEDATEPATETVPEAKEEPTETTEPRVNQEEELQAQIKELKDQLLRSLAEQDNTRRIAQKDIESARQFAIKNFAKSLLEVSDNLTRALESVPQELLADKEKNAVLGSLYEGIYLTEVGLNKAFEMNGLVKYGEIGDKFDPNQHEALMQYPDPNKEDGVVGQVMKKGFLLNKRVLRPAEVGVVKNS